MCFDVEMAWDSFKLIFHSFLYVLAPIKEIRLKQRTEPWLNSEIVQNIRHEDGTLKRFRKTKDPDLYKLYCNLRNKVQRETRNSKRDYLANNKASESIEKLGYNSNGKEAVISYWKMKMKCIDPKKVANCFDNFFTTVASKLVDKLSSSFNLFHTESLTFKEFYVRKMFRQMNSC